MFFIANKFGGDDYYVKEFQRIYDRFVFNLGIYGGHKVYRQKVYLEALQASDDVVRKVMEYRTIALGGVGTLNIGTKNLIKRTYKELYGEE